MVEQNDVAERAIATWPDEIVINVLDEKGSRAILDKVRRIFRREE